MISKGLSPDNVVGICIEEGLSMVLAQLAVLMAGAAFVSIDLSLPQRYHLNFEVPELFLNFVGRRIVSMARCSDMRHLIFLSKSVAASKPQELGGIPVHFAEEIFPDIQSIGCNIPGKRCAPEEWMADLQHSRCVERDEVNGGCCEDMKKIQAEESEKNGLVPSCTKLRKNESDGDVANAQHTCWIFFTSGNGCHSALTKPSAALEARYEVTGAEMRR